MRSLLLALAFCAIIVTVTAACGYQSAAGGTVTLPVDYDTTIANADPYGIFYGAPNRNYGGSAYIRVRNGTNTWTYGENRVLIATDNCYYQYGWDMSRVTSVALHLSVADWLGSSSEMQVKVNELIQNSWVYYEGNWDWMGGSSVLSENSYGVDGGYNYGATWSCLLKYVSGAYDESSYCPSQSYYGWNGVTSSTYMQFEGQQVTSFSVPQTYNSWVTVDLTSSYKSLINNYNDYYLSWKLSMSAPTVSTGIGAMFHSSESSNQNSRPYFTITYSALGCDQPGTDGAVCESNNPCAASAYCSSGQCVPSTFNVGSTCDDGNECTSGDQCTDNGVCMGGNPAFTEGISCAILNNVCMTSGVCTSGVCVANTPRNCSAYGNECNDAFCDPVQGCVSIPKANGISCGSAGSRCSATCRSGVCDSSTPQNCSFLAADQCSSYSTCNDNTGLCNVQAKAPGTACNDGNLCTTNDACSNGVCTGTATQCTVTDSECQERAFCDGTSGSCVVVPKTDGTPCGADKCSSTCRKGVCTNTAPVVCPSAPNDGCHASACDSATGMCLGVKPLDDGTVCNDGKKCTDNDKCTSGVCMGVPKSCGAASQCHVDGACDESSGQCMDVAAPFGTACDDGDDETGNDICIVGQCKGKRSNANGVIPHAALVVIATVFAMLVVLF